VAWREEGGTFFLDVELPPNTSAEVWMPAADERSLREGGAGPDTAPGVRLLRQEGGRAVLAIESGHYAFSSSLSVTPR
jgi:alpha-L-rhamnosidase